jgi:hypothetical protein
MRAFQAMQEGFLPFDRSPAATWAQIGRSVIRPSPLSGMGTFYLLAEKPVLNSQKQACHLIAQVAAQDGTPLRF